MMKFAVREELLLISRVHNCLALICTLSRASQAPGSPSTSEVTESKQKSEGDTATADAATGGGAGTGGANADAGAGAQQLSRELTDLTLVFWMFCPPSWFGCRALRPFVGPRLKMRTTLGPARVVLVVVVVIVVVLMGTVQI